MHRLRARFLDGWVSIVPHAFLVLTLLCTVGCAGPPKGPRVAYRAEEADGVYALVGPAGSDLLVVEGHGKPKVSGKLFAPVYMHIRLQRLDLQSDRTSVLGEADVPIPPQVAYAPDGRIAMVDGDLTKTTMTSGIAILDARGTWITAVPKDRYLRFVPMWCADSRRLVYGRFSVGTKGTIVGPKDMGPGELVVATVAANGKASERTLLPLPSIHTALTRSADGNTIYVTSIEDDRTLRLLAVHASSGKSRLLPAPGFIGTLSAALEGGALFWLATPNGKCPLHLWRQQGASTGEDTGATFDAPLGAFQISPDGRRLATVSNKGGAVVVTTVSDGRKTTVGTYPEMNPSSLRWTSDGESLVFVSDRHSVMVVPVPSAGTK